MTKLDTWILRMVIVWVIVITYALWPVIETGITDHNSLTVFFGTTPTQQAAPPTAGSVSGWHQCTYNGATYNVLGPC